MPAAQPRRKKPTSMSPDLAAIVARYEDADDLTTIHANLDALEGTQRCICCVLSRTDPKAHGTMTAMLANKEAFEDVSAYLNAAGYAISISMLSRHTREHLKPGLLNVAIKTGALARIAKTAFGIPSGDLATMTLRAMMVPLTQALDDFEGGDTAKVAKRYKKLLESDPIAFAQHAASLARALAAVQRSVKQAEIMDAKLELDRLRLKEAYERAFAIAQREMTDKLMQTPEGRQLLPILHRLLNPQPEAKG